MSTRKRSTSGSKKQLKEKIVQIYEAFFRVSLMPKFSIIDRYVLLCS